VRYVANTTEKPITTYVSITPDSYFSNVESVPLGNARKEIPQRGNSARIRVPKSALDAGVSQFAARSGSRDRVRGARVISARPPPFRAETPGAAAARCSNPRGCSRRSVSEFADEAACVWRVSDACTRSGTCQAAAPRGVPGTTRSGRMSSSGVASPGACRLALGLRRLCSTPAGAPQELLYTLLGFRADVSCG